MNAFFPPRREVRRVFELVLLYLWKFREDELCGRLRFF